MVTFLQRMLKKYVLKQYKKKSRLQNELNQVLLELQDYHKKKNNEAYNHSVIETLIAKNKNPQELWRIANNLYESEPSKAIKLWRASMGKGHLDSKYSYVMALLNRKEKVNANKMKECVEHLRELADSGHAWAQFSFATALYNGNGICKNTAESLKYFKKCASQGIPPAYYNIANMYAVGEGTEVNKSIALEWYHKAVEAGDPKAMSYLADAYSNGKGVDKDVHRGFKLRQQAASCGNILEIYNMGWHYLIGEGIDQDYKEAYKYFSLAASKGYVMAMVNIGLMYRDGLGVPKDLEMAKKWFQLAAPHDKQAPILLKQLEDANEEIPKEAGI